MPNSGRRSLFFALAAAAFIALAGTARAQAPALTLKVTSPFTGNQVIYGGPSTYTVSAPPVPWFPSGQVTYYWRQTDTVNGVPSQWRNHVDGLSWGTTESTPGTFEAKATVTLTTQQSPQNPNPPKVPVTTPTITVKVAPPDGIKQLPAPVNNINWNAGLNGQNQIVVYIATPTTLGFPVTCAGFTPNSLPGATLTEDVVNTTVCGVGQPPKINEKITMGGISGITLMDQKTQTIGTKQWKWFQGFTNGSYGPGYVFAAYKQTLKLQIPDLNGTPKIFPVGTFIFNRTSTNGGTTPTNITVTPPPN